MQQSATVFQRGSRNDAVIGLADSNARLTQFSIDIGCTKEYGLWHGQHNQRIEIASDTPMSFVIGNSLQDFSQYDTAQSQVFVLKDELLQRGDMRQVLSLIHISEPTRPSKSSRMPSSA